MIRVLLLSVMLAGFPGSALACDDHVGKCKLEAWQARYTKALGFVTLHGSATCNSGRIIVRMYDGDKFLGVGKDHIEGHALEMIPTIAKGLDIADFKIKYSIEPR